MESKKVEKNKSNLISNQQFKTLTTRVDRMESSIGKISDRVNKIYKFLKTSLNHILI